MTDIAIRCEGLSKQYRIGERESYKALRDVITDAAVAALLTVSIAVVILILAGGLYYFRRLEQTFADVV